jgi:tetratricopeptide (TPR) repeat protein
MACTEIGRNVKVKIIRTIAIGIVFCGLLAPAQLFAADDEKMDLWPLSTFLESAKVQYKYVYKKTKSREDLYVAIEYLKEAVKRYPQAPEPFFMMGTFYAEVNILDTMSMMFDSVNTFCADPEVEEKYRKKCDKEDYPEKIEKLRSKYWEASYNDGVKFLNQYDTCQAMLASAPAGDSAQKVDSLCKLAFHLADDNLRLATLVRPSDPRTYDIRGLLLERENQFEEAAEQYLKALEMYRADIEKFKKDKQMPKDFEDRMTQKIAYAYIQIPDWENSVEWFDQVIEQNPEDINAYLNISIALKSLRRFDEAYEYSKKLLEVDPNNETAWFNMGQYWFVKFQDIAGEISQIDDSLPGAEDKRAELMAQREEFAAEAQKSLEKASELNPQDLDVLYLLGLIYLFTQQPDMAAATFEKYAEIDPKNKDVLDFMGRAHIMNKEFEKAIKPYEMLKEIDPGNIDAWEQLIELYKHVGDDAKAKEAEDKVAELKELAAP